MVGCSEKNPNINKRASSPYPERGGGEGEREREN
jgi:hypothetical protein